MEFDIEVPTRLETIRRGLFVITPSYYFDALAMIELVHVEMLNQKSGTCEVVKGEHKLVVDLLNEPSLNAFSNIKSTIVCT